ncbi:NADH dehydrogenase ubiquinone 1 beta subcomplex subunit 1 [Vespula maculifrons]|uniref:NADH dehydrogenase ubiquinone 1 beta subcomplex subunit 1 n=2 Tax=Vespula TaxID=7451 RepID=A0ABD2D3M0_VESMC
MGAAKSFGYYINRYCLIVSFPTITASSIYFDLRRSKLINMITFKYLLNNYFPFALPITGFLIGSYLDHQENLRLTKFRDKSALYGREVASGQPHSWP